MDNQTRTRRRIRRDAVRRRLIAESPFAEVQGFVVRSNRSRDYVVSRADAAAVLKSLPRHAMVTTICPEPIPWLTLTLRALGAALGRCGLGTRQNHDTQIARPSTTTDRASASCRCSPELQPYLLAVREELLADFDPKQKSAERAACISRYRQSNINLRAQLLQDHPSRRVKTVTQAAPESAGHAGDGVGPRASRPRRRGIDGTHTVPRSPISTTGQPTRTLSRRYPGQWRTCTILCSRTRECPATIRSQERDSHNLRCLRAVAILCTMRNGRHWTRTSDLCGVNTAL
jgi:hypothetical protein